LHSGRKFIRTLIGRGHLSQIVVSHDIRRKRRLLEFGGHGYGHIFEGVLPLIRSRLHRRRDRYHPGWTIHGVF
jgi:hypothetical protein